MVSKLQEAIEEAKKFPSVNHYFDTGITNIPEMEWYSLALQLGGRLEWYNKKMDISGGESKLSICLPYYE